jgi:thiol-disulfide isomerase/thioredoxin
VYYQSAGVLSTIGKPEEALVKVEKAIENGFTQLPILLEDPALEKVRELPAWSEKLSTWEAAARERMIESAKAEMADYQSFPFDFTLTDVAGMPVSLAALKGKVCIVDLWGTWCPPCREEIPSFIKLQQKFAAAGFQMIGLNEERGGSDEDKTAKVTEFIAQSGINYPCALITDEVRAQVPDLQGYPTTLFIDRSGKVRLMAVGMHEYAYLEAVVEMLLNEDSGETAAPAAPASDAAAPPEK